MSKLFDLCFRDLDRGLNLSPDTALAIGAGRFRALQTFSGPRLADGREAPVVGRIADTQPSQAATPPGPAQPSTSSGLTAEQREAEAHGFGEGDEEGDAEMNTSQGTGAEEL